MRAPHRNRLQTEWAEIAARAIKAGIRPDVEYYGPPKTLLSESRKGDPAEDLGYKNVFFYGAPAGEAFAPDSRRTACPWSGACEAVCLITNSGQIRLPASRRAGVQRMALLYGNPGLFFDIMADELERLINKSAHKGLKVAFRGDGGTDLKITRRLLRAHPELAEEPTLEIYDYTKDARGCIQALQSGHGRELAALGYATTYSVSEASTLSDIETILDLGGSVTIVTDRRKGDALPPTWRGYPTVDGDAHDLVHLDPPGTVRVLAMKYSGKGGHARGVELGAEGGFITRMNDWVD